MNNAFYFTLKALFVLKVFKFLCWFLGHYKNGLIKKISLISKLLTSQPGLQTIAIHILPNISRSKGNQTIKFGQLIEYNMRNIFHEKLFPDRFLKYPNWAFLWINSLRFYTVCFHCIPSWGLSKYIWAKLQITCFYLK